MPVSYRFLRLKLASAGLLPQSKLARFTAYLAALDLLFYLAGKLLAALGVLPTLTATLRFWVGPLTFLVVVLGTVLGLKWVRLHLMWRLRNRLIVTYMFIGVIPVLLLVSMALIAGWLFAGQFATYVATNDFQAELSKLDATNSVLGTEIAVELRGGASPEKVARLFEQQSRSEPLPAEFAFWYGGKSIAIRPEPGVAGAIPAWPRPESGQPPKEFRAVVATADSRLHMRAVRQIAVGNQTVTVMSGEPLDQKLLERVAAGLGQVTLDASEMVFAEPGKERNFVIHAGGAPPPRGPNTTVLEVSPRQARAGRLSAGKAPPALNRWDREVSFGTPFIIADWTTGRTTRVLLLVNTRLSELYQRLFITLGDYSRIVVQALMAVAIMFGVIELLALLIGVRLTRSMTRSVAALYEATEHINRGELRHRIEVTSYDQLAALEKSFNSMAESLEKLLAEQKEKQRIENELIIAQEVQAQLFPKQLRSLETLEVHGLCRPARTVSGDYYDFLALGHDEIGIAVGDVSGKGISAALLMATIHSAVRAYTLDRTRHELELEMPAMAAAGGTAPRLVRRSSDEVRVNVAPAELLGMLNRQLYHTTPSEKYATLFFGVYQGATRTLTYTNAGHLTPIILGADGSIRRLDVGGTVAGLFDHVAFEQAAVTLRPGDLFISFSDGVTEPENEFGEFGEHRLLDLVRENRDLPLDRISEAVTTAVRDWIGGAEQPDDITLVLARAR